MNTPKSNSPNIPWALNLKTDYTGSPKLYVKHTNTMLIKRLKDAGRHPNEIIQAPKPDFYVFHGIDLAGNDSMSGSAFLYHNRYQYDAPDTPSKSMSECLTIDGCTHFLLYKVGNMFYPKWTTSPGKEWKLILNPGTDGMKTFVKSDSKFILETLFNNGYYPQEFVYLNKKAKFVKYVGNHVRGQNIAEIEVYEPNSTVNIALNKPVTGTSLYSTTVPHSNLVDSNTTNIAHTAENSGDSGWEIDLGKEVDVSKVIVRNRTDCCSNRINGAYILLLDSNQRVFYKSPPFANSKLVYTIDVSTGTVVGVGDGPQNG
jgi:hypothetical protein